MADDRNRKFALGFEPCPTEGDWQNGTGRLSVGRAWYKHFDGLKEWQPRDFTQPEGVLMLLERMRGDLIRVDRDEGNSFHGWFIRHPYLPDGRSTFHHNLAEAVNLAFERYLEGK